MTVSVSSDSKKRKVESQDDAPQPPRKARRNSGHAGTNHPHAPKERDNEGASKFTRVLLERIPGKKGYRRVASSHRSIESERPHSCTSFPYVHDKLCAKFRSKKRLRVQNRSAGCVLSCTNSSQQQKVPQVRLRKQGVPVSGATIRSKYSQIRFLLDWDTQILGTWTHTDRKLHINCLELKAVTHALQHWAQVLRGHQVMIATDNSTVVSYINKQGGTHSPTLLRLTVELLLWLEAQSIIVRARHIPGCLNVIPPISSEPTNSDRVVPTPRDHETHFQGLGDTRSRHVRNSVKLPLSSVHVSNSRAKSPSGGCSVSRLAGEVNVHVSSFPPAQQSRSETSIHSGGRGSFHSPLVAESIVVSTPTMSLCGTPPSSSLPSGSSVPTASEMCFRRKVVPSARMEALMRLYKAAGFSDEVSRLTAAPRRPSTNCIYDVRWFRFARWAAGQGFDPLDPTAAQIASFLFTLFDTHGLSPQTVKGYRTCLGSVLITNWQGQSGFAKNHLRYDRFDGVTET